MKEYWINVQHLTGDEVYGIIQRLKEAKENITMGPDIAQCGVAYLVRRLNPPNRYVWLYGTSIEDLEQRNGNPLIEIQLDNGRKYD